MKNFKDWILYLLIITLLNLVSIISFEGVVIGSLSFIIVNMIIGDKNE